jgi:hypothetical protein
MTDPNSSLARVLAPGERLLWSGRPRQGFVLRPIDILLIPFSLVWAVIPVTFIATALKDRSFVVNDAKPAMLGFTIIPLVFCLFAVYLIFGRFIADWYYRSGVTYGITDRRAIISETKLIKRVQSINPGALRALRLDEMPDGTGTILLTEESSISPFMRSGGFGSMHAALGQPPQFFRVQDAKRAYGLLSEASRASRSPQA